MTVLLWVVAILMIVTGLVLGTAAKLALGFAMKGPWNSWRARLDSNQ